MKKAHNLSVDLKNDRMIKEKVLNEDYAQNLYAAMCNMRWQKRDVWSVLKDDFWSCTWRSSGGIVADLRERGDYMDWYCSGIGAWTDREYPKNYVAEGIVTEEIRKDLASIGWYPVAWNDEELS